MNRLIPFLFLILTGFPTFAQKEENDPVCGEPNKKAQKLIEAAKSTANAEEAKAKLFEAIKADPENVTAYYNFGMFYYSQAMKLFRSNPSPDLGSKALKTSKNMFEKVVDACPEFHANCYYYLGAIAYNLKEDEKAKNYFQKFKDFKTDDENKMPNDYGKKVQDIDKVLAKMGESQNKVDFTKNPVPFNPTIVANVSSKMDEYFPMLSPDNDMIFYTRKVDKTHRGDMIRNIVEEFTYSTRPNYLGQFDDGTPFSYPFNDGTFKSYGAATMSLDNKEMILCACKDEQVDGQTYRNCDLYSTHFTRTGKGGNDYQWTPLENMGPQINSQRGWDAQPSLSADGNTLFYTTLRAGRDATQDNDIWIAHRNADGTWGKGEPFTEINTPGKDKSPFIHQDSETLYFVSQVSGSRQGVGGLDIFYTRKVNGKWTKPKNIGYPINTTGDELGIFVSLDGKKAYFSSNNRGNWDIYSFDLYPEARPQAVKLIKGELKDDQGNPVDSATIEVAYSGSDSIQKFRVNGDDGKYAAIVHVKANQDVIVSAKKQGSAFESKLLTAQDLEQSDDPVVHGENMEVKKLKEGDTYTINDILFATNSYDLTDKSKFIIRQFANFLRENPTIEVAIQGHTDDIGNDDDNMVLSDNRAREVKDYLVQLGIASNRLSSKGFGETQPKVPNTTDANRAINRRTEFLIKKL